jgi:hypothetical protein
MGELWRIIQAHLDRYGVREAAFARQIGTVSQTLSSWKHRGLKQLPSKDLLEAVARETTTPYEDVLAAVLVDIGYASVTPESADAAPVRSERKPEPEPSPAHVPEPEDNTGVATRPAHGPSRSRAEGAADTRRHGRR